MITLIMLIESYEHMWVFIRLLKVLSRVLLLLFLSLLRACQ